ncbi:MAG: class I SAM-dependent methyltransferase [Halobacteriota archaeon]
MMESKNKMKISLSNIEETLLIPLWIRAKLSREHNSVLNDTKAIELVEQIDYDFSTLDKNPFESDLFFVARAKQFNDKIRAYIREHPRASVVNIGAGLDTTFYRVDNGLIHWYDLDLPNVIDLRKQLIPETNRITYIAKSLFDLSWYTDIENTRDGVFLMAAGVLFYFEESHIKQFFSSLADNFPGSEIVFNAHSKLGVSFANRTLRGTWVENAVIKWVLKDVNEMTTWDKRITVIDQVPYFKNIPREPAWGEEIKRRMNGNDTHKIFKIVHLRV